MARRALSPSMVNDRRDDMTLAELIEELERSHPEQVASFERRYPDAMAAVADDDLGRVILTSRAPWSVSSQQRITAMISSVLGGSAGKWRPSLEAGRLAGHPEAVARERRAAI